MNRSSNLEVVAPDVIHSWWIPALGGKIDAIPGRTNHTWFKAERSGTFTGRCAELCGAQHAAMTASVQAVSDAEFARFLAAHAPSSQTVGRGDLRGRLREVPRHGRARALTRLRPSPGGSSTRRPCSCSGTAARACRPSARTGRTSTSTPPSATSTGRSGRRRWPLPTQTAPTLDWKQGRVTGWLTTTDHKRIGILYIVTSLVFFGIAGLLALLIRLQLAAPDQSFITGDKYNELFTVHGTAMVFLVVVPILAGFGNYLVPLMIGARDMAFPKLNALSYWLFLAGGLVLYASFFAKGGASSAGWTAYPPLSESEYSPGNGVDLWILSLHLLTLSSLAGAINFVVTILNMRTRGMTFMRMPLFIWAIFTYAVLLILILPVLSGGLTLLLLDRQLGTHFFIPDEGGSALLWQNVFWFFGHPEVYVMILPAFGIVSEVIPVFARKPIFGYAAIAFSTLGIAFAGMLVWAHHLFTVGMGTGLNSYFMIASFLVAIPTGIKILNWLATLWRGNISFDTPMLFALGLIALFVIGGLTGHLRRGVSRRLAAARHVLRRRALPLHAVRRRDVRDLRGPVLLVAEDVRAPPRRTARQVALLADVRRLQPRLHAAALPRAAGHAAPDLHVLRGRIVGDLQPPVDDRRLPHGGGYRSSSQ